MHGTLNSTILTKTKNEILRQIEDDRRSVLEINEGKFDPKFTNMLFDQRREGVVELYFKIMEHI